MSHPLVLHCKSAKFLALPANQKMYIGRPSYWGNPFSHKQVSVARFKVATLEEAVLEFEKYLRATRPMLRKLYELKGKVLGCWCTDVKCSGEPCTCRVKPLKCHGVILAQLANTWRCSICYLNPVTPEDGEDTCQYCLSNI